MQHGQSVWDRYPHLFSVAAAIGCTLIGLLLIYMMLLVA